MTLRTATRSPEKPHHRPFAPRFVGRVREVAAPLREKDQETFEGRDVVSTRRGDEMAI